MPIDYHLHTRFSDGVGAPVDYARAARERGIPVTLGSDAHRPEDLGRDFDQALALLRSCGYTQVSRFAGRRRIQVPLAPTASASGC